MEQLRKIGGVSALIAAAIYVLVFAFFGVYWKYPVDAGVSEKLAYLSEHQVHLYCVNLVGYVVFGITLLFLVLAIHERLRNSRPLLSCVSAAFGILWVGLVIAAGMIANVGLRSAIDLSSKEPDRALATLSTINQVVEGIGGGNEIVGGLWVLFLSVAALGGSFSRTLSYFGIFVGAIGVATVAPADVLTEIFGVSQIIWFTWLGFALLRKS